MISFKTTISRIAFSPKSEGKNKKSKAQSLRSFISERLLSQVRRG